ncbi:Hypothetical predicted protein [Podarcis lilfordi]|uniref:Uncharacterized protein n=1 Tax=Podarcis lilfordi TaxID=74358 RepID=A0AA35P4M1_9SAUR|nr:Hypothetical predicted protein [Podarcis lilfordi]
MIRHSLLKSGCPTAALLRVVDECQNVSESGESTNADIARVANFLFSRDPDTLGRGASITSVNAKSDESGAELGGIRRHPFHFLTPPFGLLLDDKLTTTSDIGMDLTGSALCSGLELMLKQPPTYSLAWLLADCNQPEKCIEGDGEWERYSAMDRVLGGSTKIQIPCVFRGEGVLVNTMKSTGCCIEGGEKDDKLLLSMKNGFWEESILEWDGDKTLYLEFIFFIEDFPDSDLSS